MAQPIVNAKIEELQFRIKTDPKSRLFFPLAEEFRKNGRLPEAEQVLRTGLGVHATYLSAWVSLGRVLREQHKNAEAVDALTTALQVDPGNVVAARLLADAYLDLGEKLEAIKKYKLVQALMPSDEDLEAKIAQLDRDLNPAPPVTIAPAPEEASTSQSFAAAPAIESTPEASGAPDSLPDPWLAEEPVATVAQPSVFSPPEVPEPENAPEPESPLPAAEPVTQGLAAFTSEAAAENDSWLPTDEEVPAEPVQQVMSSDHAETAPPTTSPFDSSSESVFDETSPVLHTIERPFDTDDEIPMSAQHADSPFEEPSSYSAAALTIEHPGGIHIEQAPPDAEVASVWADETDDVSHADISSVSERESRDQDDDLGVTATMADLYVRQGLTEDARRIYEQLLQRDPSNEDLRAKLVSLAAPPAAETEFASDPATPSVEAEQVQGRAEAGAPRNAKVVVLEQWLTKVARREPGGA